MQQLYKKKKKKQIFKWLLGTTAHCIWHFALIKHPY